MLLPAMQGSDHPVPAGGQREHRRIRSVRGAHRSCACAPERVGACGWRVRAVGEGGAGACGLSTRGLEQADSWATDAHKWLNVPYDSGLAFVRDANALEGGDGDHRRIPADGVEAERNPSDFTPELSRRARGVEVWSGAARARARGASRSCSSAIAARRAALRPGLAQAGLRGAERGGVEPGAGGVRRACERTRRVIAAHPAKRAPAGAGAPCGSGRTAMRISVCSWATSGRGRRAAASRPCCASPRSLRTSGIIGTWRTMNSSLQTPRAAKRPPAARGHRRLRLRRPVCRAGARARAR
jgi:hypothetical protein